MKELTVQQGIRLLDIMGQVDFYFTNSKAAGSEDSVRRHLRRLAEALAETDITGSGEIRDEKWIDQDDILTTLRADGHLQESGGEWTLVTTSRTEVKVKSSLVDEMKEAGLIEWVAGPCWGLAESATGV